VDVKTEEQPTPAVLDAIALRKEAIRDAVVRIVISMSADQSALLDERAVQTAAGSASHLDIQLDVRQEVRARLGTDSAESLTPLELLERYLRAKSVDETRVNELIRAAEDLMREIEDPGV
jgi:hypothetical protein